jgi:hypothetical protein
MAGVNILFGSHFDEYIVDFVLFNQLSPASSAAIFKPPSACDNPVDLGGTRKLDSLQAISLLPASLSGGSAKVDSLTLTTVAAVLQEEAGGRGVGPASDALTHLVANGRFVAKWNAEHALAHGFALALNRFAAMPHAQFLTSSLGHVPSSAATRRSDLLLGQRLKRSGGAYLGVFRRKMKDEELPESVDYRGTGADGLVKDQAFCGSCCESGLKEGKGRARPSAGGRAVSQDSRTCHPASF